MATVWSRRRVLGAVSAFGGVGLAGCSSQFSSGGSPPAASTRSPASTPLGPVEDGPAAPAPSCPDGVESVDPRWVVAGPGPLDGFELRVDRDAYARGDELVTRLRNVTDEERTSGVEAKYDVQYLGADGWHTILGTDAEGAVVIPDLGILHEPGEGFTWRFPLTRAGVSRETDRGPTYHACQPIRPGTYRFVYWGIVTEREREEDFETKYALGVAFDVEAEG